MKFLKLTCQYELDSFVELPAPSDWVNEGDDRTVLIREQMAACP